MAIMTAGHRAPARDAEQIAARAKERPDRCRAKPVGAMALQPDRGYKAAPQMFVRLSGSHLAKPRAKQPAAEAVTG
jgi:hypothetical protein